MSDYPVVIIGAGVSGIAATKACLEEGLHPLCLEKRGYIGGLWRYTEEVEPRQGVVVYDTLRVNTNRWMTCFSDFPMSDQTETFPTHEQVKQYLENYVANFDLRQYIRLDHVVERVCKSPDFDTTGFWRVTVRDTRNGRSQTILCSGVIICNGRQRAAAYPHIDGLKDFQGEIMHTLDYRNTKCSKDKNVLIVGNSFTAGDVASETVNEAKTVCLSVGRGGWLMQRYGPTGNGLPLDFAFRRIANLLPFWFTNYVMKRASNTIIDHKKHGMVAENNKGPVHSSAIINDKLAPLIGQGKILMKPYLAKLENHKATFSDQTYLNEIDLIIFATGYKLEWDFIKNKTTPANDALTYSLPTDWANLNLYRLVWPENLDKATLAVVGCFGIQGPAFTGLELQARWVAGVFSKRLALPSRQMMMKEIVQRKRTLIDRFGYLKVTVDSLTYEDELVTELGLKPSIWQFLRNPKDILRWYFGPSFSMLYRLYGLHSWSGARRAIDLAVSDAHRDHAERMKNTRK